MAKMRLGWYVGVSTALAGSCVISAFQQRPNFYSAMVYLAQSNFCMLALLNFIFFIYSMFFYATTRLCYGRLRAIEVEQLTERAWFAVTETCLAMTIFREEIGAWFILMFTALVTGKVWGWIGDGRVEVLEQQPPTNPRLFHTRLSVSLTISLIYDLWILKYTIDTVVQQARPNMMVMFLFEFAVLSAVSLRSLIRYLLTLTEQHITKTQMQKRLEERRREVREERAALLRARSQATAAGEEVPENQPPLPSEDDVDEMDIEVPGWAEKGEWVLWLDLLTDTVKLGIYVAFFSMLLVFYGLPIHIMRDLFVTLRDFVKRATALMRYRRAIREMNQYPDATEEELARENTCIICREEMRPWDPARNPGAIDRVRPKKLPCGHTLHLGCLKSWLERQQVCPTCRSPVSGPRPTLRNGARNQNGNGVPVRNLPLGNLAENAAAAGAPHAPGQGQGDGDNRPGPQPRVYRLGPFRIGIGANIHQARQHLRDYGLQQPGLDGAPRPRGTATDQTSLPPFLSSGQPGSQDSLAEADNLLSRAERVLNDQLVALNRRQQELQTAQRLLAELHRLRQQGPGSQHDPNHVDDSIEGVFTQPTPNVAEPSHTSVNGSRASMPISRYPDATSMTRHVPANTTAIPAGSPDLPEGLVLPAGWSLMPLKKADNAAVPSATPSMPQGSNTDVAASTPGPSTVSAEATRLENQPEPTFETSISGPSDATPSSSVVQPRQQDSGSTTAGINVTGQTVGEHVSNDDVKVAASINRFQAESVSSQEDSRDSDSDVASETRSEEGRRQAEKGKGKAVSVEEDSDDSED